jgi:hypothetical protein
LDLNTPIQDSIEADLRIGKLEAGEIQARCEQTGLRLSNVGDLPPCRADPALLRQVYENPLMSHSRGESHDPGK